MVQSVLIQARARVLALPDDRLDALRLFGLAYAGGFAFFLTFLV